MPCDQPPIPVECRAFPRSLTEVRPKALGSGACNLWEGVRPAPSELRPMTSLESPLLADADLLAGCCAGDERCWEQLYRRYHPLVRAVTSWSKWRFTPSEAEDCAQDVFVELARVLGGFRGEASLATFLTRLARNRCISYIRRKTALKRGREVVGYCLEERKGSEEPMALAVDPTPQPDAILLAQDEGETILRFLRTLSPDCQTILGLRYFEDLAYDEICRRLELPIGTVCSRIKRCLDRLRRLALGGLG